MKILNLDTVKPTQRTIVINKKKYEVKAMTCGLFVSLQQLQDDKKEVSAVDQVKQYIEIVEMMIPTLPKKLVLSLEFDQLLSIIQFATDASEEDNKDGVKDEVGKMEA